jgi:hypothetical protein
VLPDTFQAALVTSLVVLPGALYTWGIERVIGHWGPFVSLLFPVRRAPSRLPPNWILVLPPGLRLRPAPLRTGRRPRSQPPVAMGARHRRESPRPESLGHGLGSAESRLCQAQAEGLGPGRPASMVGRLVWVGEEPEPHRILRRSLPGVSGSLSRRDVPCDEQTGELLMRDGDLVALHEGLLIRWEEVHYLYLTPSKGWSRALA